MTIILSENFTVLTALIVRCELKLKRVTLAVDAIAIRCLECGRTIVTR